MTLLRQLTFLLRSQTLTLTVLLFWISFLLMLVFVLQWFFLYWEFLIMLLSQFPSTFHQIHNRMPHFIEQLMTILVLIGMVLVIIRDNIFKLTATSEFCEFVSGFRLELMYISIFVLCIRSSLTHLHGF